MNATTTTRGRELRDELNKALGSENGGTYIPFDSLGDLSLLARRAKRYATMQEQACSYEWANGEAWDAKERRLEQSIEELAKSIPGVVGVTFGGDPRGYVVKLVLDNGAYNSWGGAEECFGIA